jgi:hypothetical protein
MGQFREFSEKFTGRPVRAGEILTDQKEKEVGKTGRSSNGFWKWNKKKAEKSKDGVREYRWNEITACAILNAQKGMGLLKKSANGNACLDNVRMISIL